MFNKLKVLGAAAALAVLPMVAGAVTITTNGPIENAVVDLTPPDVHTIEIAGDASDGAGSASFGFKATAGLLAIETNSLNPVTGFAGAMVEWNSAADGSGISFGSISGAALIAGAELITSFAAGEEKWLIASWTDVTQVGSNFDLRVVAAVPVPAAGLLLLTAVGGAAALRRRKKADA